LEQYTHFTSPIRRYPDLVVHRLLRKVLSGETGKLPNDKSLPEKLAVIANHSSMRERIAEEAERKIIAIKRTRYMQDKIGEEFIGIISGITAFGFFVELEEIFVEGLVPIRNLSDDYYLFNERKHRLEGYQSKRVFCIGDRVRIRVAHVDLTKLHIDFTFLTKLHEPSYE
jgi:ribonuclease R